MWSDSIAFTVLSIASANALGAGLAMGLVLVTGPFLNVKVENMRLVHVGVRPRAEIVKELQPFMIGIMLFILGITTLPVIAVELTYARASGLPFFSLLLRYGSLWPEIFVLYGLILSESIYAYRRPAPPEAAPPAP